MVDTNSKTPLATENPPASLEALLHQLAPPDLQALCERRFREGYSCPRCHSRHVQGHGQYRGRRRFRCVDCGRTFNELTSTPLHGTRHPDKWPAFLCCLYWGLSLRRTARLVGISVPTAFAWRHKVLDALRQGATSPVLEGILELDEVYILESQKGSRHLTRPPRRRGTGDAINRWRPHRDRACVLVVVDRGDGAHAAVTGMGQPTVFDVEQMLKSTDFRPYALCTDNRQAYWSFSVRHRVPRVVLSHPRQRNGLYHVANVDGFLKRFEDWMTRFNGVATRYLANYVAWFIRYDEALRWQADPVAVSEQWLARSFDLPRRAFPTNLSLSA